MKLEMKKKGLRKSQLCKCGKNKKERLHICPYAQDVNGDEETRCPCCDECMQACMDDI